MGTTFQDRAARTWDLAITVETVRRVRKLVGVNLLDALGGKLLVSLAQDPMAFADTLWAIVQPQAEAKGVTDEHFGASLAGPEIESATAAFMEAVQGFFARPGQRELIRGVMDKLEATQTAAERLSLGRLAGIDPEALALQAAQTSSGPSGTPPASAGSTPTPTPPASCSPCGRAGSVPSGAAVPSSSP